GSAYGIDFFIRAPDCDLGPITCFARDAANLYGAVRDFAYFQLEKPAHKIRVTARNNDLRTPDSIFHCDNVRAESIAHIVIFHYDSLALGHDSLKFSKIENHVC